MPLPEFDVDEPRWSECAEAPAAERRLAVAQALRALLPADCVLSRDEELRPYECDGLSVFRQQPMLVVLPRTEDAAARGAAWSAAGSGCRWWRAAPAPACRAAPCRTLPGVVLSLARFNRILEIDPAARIARVQPGVRNLAVSEAAAAHGLFYAPDPSSQIACTIGGNVAENSGGVHCLKYGLTLHNVLGLRGCTIDGEPIELGGRALDAPGLDLLALCIGSEGLLLVVTEVILKLLPKPQLAQVVMASFDDVGKAGEAVAAIIAAGIIPAGLEMMDRKATAAVEPFVHAGYDLAAEAILLAESDGTPEEVGEEVAAIERVLRAAGATAIAVSRSRSRAAALLVGTQERLSRRRPHLARLLLHGRHHSAQEPGRRCSRRSNRWSSRYGLQVHERVSRRRRQPAPVDPVRRQPRGRMGTRRSLRRRYPGAVRAAGRHHHRRARRRRREDQFDVRAVLAGRARRVLRASSAPSIRPGCSIPARPFRRWRAAPSTAACTCDRGQLAHPDLPRF